MYRTGNLRLCDNWGTKTGVYKHPPTDIISSSEGGYRRSKITTVSPAMIVKDVFWSLWNPTKRIYSVKRDLPSQWRAKSSDVLIIPDDGCIGALERGEVPVFGLNKIAGRYTNFLKQIDPRCLKACVEKEFSSKEIKKMIDSVEIRASYEDLGCMEWDHHKFTFNIDYLLVLDYLGFDVLGVVKHIDPGLYENLVSSYQGTYFRNLKQQTVVGGPQILDLVEKMTDLKGACDNKLIKMNYNVIDQKPRPLPFGIATRPGWDFGMKDIFEHFQFVHRPDTDECTKLIDLTYEDCYLKSIECAKMFVNSPTKIEKVEKDHKDSVSVVDS